MSLIELSSTLTGTAPATGGRIMRPCTMPGTLMSVTKSSVPNTFGATSSRGSGCADDLVLARLLRLRLAGRVERDCRICLFQSSCDVEIAPADQLGVADLLRRIAAGVHDAVGDGELIGRNAELLGRHLDQHAARFGGRLAHLPAAELDAGRARAPPWFTLVAVSPMITVTRLERHVELFGHDLADGDEQALAHVHLAEEGRRPCRRH